MLTHLTVRNFKRFDTVEVELANPIVFIGANNSGKTTALQALALWEIGLRKWLERREGGKATRRTGVTINRRELVSIPLRTTASLWHDLRVRTGNTPRHITIELKGQFNGQIWECGLEFDSVDPENIRCRPIDSAQIPDGARQIRVAFLPPMSGLISQEDRLQPGSIERRIGEGRTADVLRNLCYQVWEQNPSDWEKLTAQMESLFGAKLRTPVYFSESGTLQVEYEERNKTVLDLTASGQGFRQTLLLLAYLYSKPSSVLLLDEPDAHLEILRQRQIYTMLVQAAHSKGNQIMIATHSEVILSEAALKNTVVAFVGKPHRLPKIANGTSKTAQVQKALAEYGFDHYYQAEQTGWVLYLEGSTDLAILQAFAKTLEHTEAKQALERPFVHYVGNQPGHVQKHFYAVREAVPDLIGVALFDRLEQTLSERDQLRQMAWTRREIENYLAFPETLEAFAEAEDDTLGLGSLEQGHRRTTMAGAIRSLIPPIALTNRDHVWWKNNKMSDDFLTPLFADYYSRLELPNSMAKKSFYQLAEFVPPELIADEVREKLDAIVQVAQAAETRMQQQPAGQGASNASQTESFPDQYTDKDTELDDDSQDSQ